MSEAVEPSPRLDGKCSNDCPFHCYEHQRGWPVVETCEEWDEMIDGEGPFYMDGSAICKPALRLATQPTTATEEGQG